MLKPWMEQFSIILGHPVQSEDPDDWSIRMEVISCLYCDMSAFGQLVHNEVVILTIVF